jgi:hypothetical protein
MPHFMPFSLISLFDISIIFIIADIFAFISFHILPPYFSIFRFGFHYCHCHFRYFDYFIIFIISDACYILIIIDIELLPVSMPFAAAFAAAIFADAAYAITVDYFHTPLMIFAIFSFSPDISRYRHRHIDIFLHDRVDIDID